MPSRVATFSDALRIRRHARSAAGFRGDRGTKSKPIPGPHNVYGFLTTELNAVVKQTRSQNEAYNRCRHVVVRHSKFVMFAVNGFKHSKEDSP